MNWIWNLASWSRLITLKTTFQIKNVFGLLPCQWDFKWLLNSSPLKLVKALCNTHLFPLGNSIHFRLKITIIASMISLKFVMVAIQMPRKLAVFVDTKCLMISSRRGISCTSSLYLMGRFKKQDLQLLLWKVTNISGFFKNDYFSILFQNTMNVLTQLNMVVNTNVSIH